MLIRDEEGYQCDPQKFRGGIRMPRQTLVTCRLSARKDLQRPALGTRNFAITILREKSIVLVKGTNRARYGGLRGA